MANSSVGGLFQYTSRGIDLVPQDGWVAGDLWDKHYVQAGYEDRDRELEDYLGNGITTRRLLLVDQTGTIVSEFTPTGPFGAALLLLHRDALVTDGYLAWTSPANFGAGTEEVILSGPEKLAAAGVPPAVVLSVAGTLKTTILQGSNELDLATEDAAGVPAAEFDLTASTGVITTFTSLLDVLNLSGAAHAEIKASAFTVVSTERAKTDIEVMNDERLLDLVRSVRAHRFRNSTRPQSPHRAARPKDLIRAERTPDLYRDHDCAADDCSGSAEIPCPLVLNDTFRIGLIAEHVYEVAPEITNLDATNQPDSIAVDQVAASAFGAAGALLRKVEALEARVAQLEGLTGV